jgi:hypothetical protein
MEAAMYERLELVTEDGDWVIFHYASPDDAKNSRTPVRVEIARGQGKLTDEDCAQPPEELAKRAPTKGRAALAFTGETFAVARMKQAQEA